MLRFTQLQVCFANIDIAPLFVLTTGADGDGLGYGSKQNTTGAVIMVANSEIVGGLRAQRHLTA